MSFANPNRRIRITLAVVIAIISLVILLGAAFVVWNGWNDELHLPLALLSLSALLIIASSFISSTSAHRLWLGIAAHPFLLVAGALIVIEAKLTEGLWFPVVAMAFLAPPALLLLLWWMRAILFWRDGFPSFLRQFRELPQYLWSRRKCAALLASFVLAVSMAVAFSIRRHNRITCVFPDGTPAAAANITFSYSLRSYVPFQNEGREPAHEIADAKGRVQLTRNQARGIGWDMIEISADRDGKRFEKTIYDVSLELPATVVLEQ